MELDVKTVKEKLCGYFASELKENHFDLIKEVRVYCCSLCGHESCYALGCEAIDSHKKDGEERKSLILWFPVQHEWIMQQGAYGKEVACIPEKGLCEEGKYLVLKIMADKTITIEAKKQQPEDFPYGKEDARLKFMAYLLTVPKNRFQDLYWCRDLTFWAATCGVSDFGYVLQVGKQGKLMEAFLINNDVEYQYFLKINQLRKETNFVCFQKSGRKMAVKYDGNGFFIKKLYPITFSVAKKFSDLPENYIPYDEPVPIRDNEKFYWLVGSKRRNREKALLDIDSGCLEFFKDDVFREKFYPPEPRDEKFIYE